MVQHGDEATEYVGRQFSKSAESRASVGAGWKTHGTNGIRKFCSQAPGNDVIHAEMYIIRRAMS